MRPLFLTQTVTAVTAALEGELPEGPIAMIEWPRLGRQLSARHPELIQIASKPKALRRFQGPRVYAEPERLPLADRSLAALVFPNLSVHADPPGLLTELSRVLVDGGLLVLVDRALQSELTRLVLCGGLAEIEQRQAGRTVVTSGRVFELPAAALG